MSQEHSFHFSRRSGTGALVLLGLLLVALLTGHFLPYFFTPPADKESKALQRSWEQFQQNALQEDPAGEAGAPAEAVAGPVAVAHLAPFDPNTATEAELIGLGLPVRTARTLLKYRGKGGTFRKKEDLQKLYTLSKQDYARIAPYVRIAVSGNAGDGAPFHRAFTAAKPAIIDLNTADAPTLVALRGIGAGYARRILNFRNALGGFVKVEQLQEVYGFPDSTYQLLKDRFVVHAGSFTPINVNTATEEELGRHPYIGRKIAAGIIKLRNELKTFDELTQLHQVPLLNDEKYRKIAPYLSTH